MNKEELMTMLEMKRKIVAPVDLAYQNYAEANSVYLRRRSQFNGILIFLWVFSILGVLLAGMRASGGLLIVTILVTVAKMFLWVQPAKEKMEAAHQLYQEEAANPIYIQGKEGFPEQFYNYTALYRLRKLLAENRADDLKEAFNILENQQYNETQINMQEEMRALQQDTANSAKIAAIATTVTAFNTWNKK